MIYIFNRIIFAGKSGFPGRSVRLNLRHRKKTNYNILSFLIKFNKPLTISFFIFLSGFLFIYCSTAPVHEKQRSAVTTEDLIQPEQAPAAEAEKAVSENMSPAAQTVPEVYIPDLRNINSILNLEYPRDRLGGIFWREKDFNSTVYLSFDDGPNMNLMKGNEGFQTISDSILDTLKVHNIKAVFFINGQNLEFAVPAERDELKRVLMRMINEGHLIGNHSYNHHNLARGIYADGMNDREDIAREFNMTQAGLNDILEFVYPLVLVRPPYAEPGRSNELDLWLQSEQQYLISLQFDSYDYAFKADGNWNEVRLLERMEELLDEQPEGGVLLLHELESTAAILPGYIDKIITEKGFTTGKMEDLLIKKYGR